MCNSVFVSYICSFSMPEFSYKETIFWHNCGRLCYTYLLCFMPIWYFNGYKAFVSDGGNLSRKEKQEKISKMLPNGCLSCLAIMINNENNTLIIPMTAKELIQTHKKELKTYMDNYKGKEPAKFLTIVNAMSIPSASLN